ncbi:MAG TPA: helix-turn-helix domain-containing protein [Cellulomonas sp.]
MDTSAAPRRPRSDAQRNVAALLDAAKTVFAEAGVDAPAKRITDLAGVGVGTLYRHFPLRSDLIVAVLQHEIDDCVAAATTLAAELAPWQALTAWVDQFVAFVGTKHGLSQALHSGDPAYSGLPGRLLAQLEPALDGLLGAARASGELAATIGGRDVLLAVARLCQPVQADDPGENQRMARIFVNGLRHA